MSKVITFTKVRLQFGWLSCMSPHRIEYETLVYPTAEALFQARRFNNEAIREQIRAARSPMAAKMVAKAYAEHMIFTRCCDADVENMRQVLQLKVEQHPSLATQLLATGDARIIEDVTTRRTGTALFWGAALVDGEWVGTSKLGELWMERRNALRAAGVGKGNQL